MKKFLLTLFAVCMTAMTYAQETVYFTPGETGNYELQVDTVKYPYLKDVPVNWYVGFDEVTFGNSEIVVNARKVQSSEIITIDGKKLLHTEKVGNDWFGMPYEGAPVVRTLKLFYAHNIGTKSVTDEYGTFYEVGDFDDMICDTVAILHIQKELTQADIKSFQVNSSNRGITDLTIGDTAKFTIVPENALDILEYALVANDEAIAVSDSGYFEIIPTETIENISLVVTNKLGELELPWKKTLNVYPEFAITNLQYSLSNNGKTTIVQNPNVTEVEIHAINHDSLTLLVETNIEETLGSQEISFTWNKDGKTLPSTITVDKGELIIPEYSKPEMDGTYNCLISAKDTTIVTSFIITSDFATANDNINLSNVVVSAYNGNIVITNAPKGSIYVTNVLGQTVYNGVNTSDILSVPVKQGVYLVTVEGKTYKVISK